MAEVVVSWRDYGCFGPPGPWSEETYQNERSAGEALLAKEWNRSRAYYVNGKAVSHAQVVASLAHYEKREADAERRAQRHAAEAAALAQARREAVAEALHQGFGVGPLNAPVVWLEAADDVIAAYEGASV